MYQMMPNQRTRNITGIVFASDARKATGEYDDAPHGDKWYDDLLAYMCSLHVPCAVSPIHSDPYSLEDVKQWIERHTDAKTGKIEPEYADRVPKVGEPHPEHAHIVFAFPGAKSRDQISKLMQGYCPIRETMWQEVKNLKGMIRYFCHLDEIDPNQLKYDTRLLYAFGGLDVSCLDQTNEITRIQTLFEIMEYVEKEHMKHYSQLVRWAMHSGDSQIFAQVAGRASFFAAYFKGQQDERTEQAAKDKKEAGQNV